MGWTLDVQMHLRLTFSHKCDEQTEADLCLRSVCDSNWMKFSSIFRYIFEFLFVFNYFHWCIFSGTIATCATVMLGFLRLWS